ncbi:MAG: hypothetical protein RBT87_13420 [bacterium]|nr:hypothetical protein [bacterium]
MVKTFLKILFISVLLLSGCKNGKSSVDQNIKNDEDSAITKEDTENNNDSDPDDEKTDVNNDPDFMENDTEKDTEKDTENIPDLNDDDLVGCFEDISGLGGDTCPMQKKDDFVKRKVEMSKSETEGFTLKIDEILFLDDRGEVVPRGECGQTNKCGITFKNYDKTLFQNSLIGKEVVLYSKEGFYGSVSNEVQTRAVYVSRHKDGTLISVAGIGIVNEDGENDWDIKVWPSELVPEIKVEQKILSDCEKVCQVTTENYAEFPLDEPYYDQLIFPPLEFTVDGKQPVVVRNGEVIRSEGYEYFVRESTRVHPDDPDQMIYELGKKYKFDFFIVNTETLK